MDLQEAIIHAREASTRADICPECAYEHRQLAEWLEELQRYKDAGLEPCDYSAMSYALQETKRAKEDLTEMIHIIGGVGLDRLKELAQADKEDRALVLPCKVGDTVYMPVGRWKMTGYEPDVCDGFYIARDGILQIKAKNNTGNHGTYGVLGETSFLTREEAERALKGGASDA